MWWGGGGWVTINSKGKKARNGGPNKEAAGRRKALGQRLRIASPGAKGEKGRGNG
jgi:hypothetical protein